MAEKPKSSKPSVGNTVKVTRQRPSKESIDTLAQTDPPPMAPIKASSNKAVVVRKPRRTTPPKPEAPTSTADHRPERPISERVGMISLAAYLRAERRGFSPGQDLEDWLAAEREVDGIFRFR